MENIKLEPTSAMGFLERQLIRGIEPLYVHPERPEWAILDFKSRKITRYEGDNFSIVVYESYESLIEALELIQATLKRPGLEDTLSDLILKLNDLCLWNESTPAL